MILTLDNLRAGVRWRNKRENWSDLYNEGYYDIYERRANGLTREWWDATVDRLAQWKAFRGRNPPNTKTAIRTRGRRVLNQIAAAHSESPRVFRRAHGLSKTGVAGERAELRRLRRARTGPIGAPCTLADLRDWDKHVGHKRVARLMRAVGLRFVLDRPLFQSSLEDVIGVLFPP